MEADWTLALQNDDPVITVPWAATGDEAETCRFIHLRVAPHRIDEVEEARSNPLLRAALLRLNDPSSELWTSKCDAWTTSPEKGDPPFDPYEMDAEPGGTDFGAGCYIDLLPRKEPSFASYKLQQLWMDEVVGKLRAASAGATRVELILRRAEVDESTGFGMTCFVEGCGPTADYAGQRLEEALMLTLAVFLGTPIETIQAGRYNSGDGRVAQSDRAPAF